MKKTNRGFSLVELIIVVAIIAILVGLLAPNLVRYYEKTKVSSDTQLLDSVYQAVKYAIVDVEVQADEDSRNMMDSWSGAVTLDSIDDGTNNVLCEEIKNTLGWSSLHVTNYEKYLSSAHNSSTRIYLYVDGRNLKGLWLSHTDRSGKKNTSENPTSMSTVIKCISVPVHMN